MASDLSCLTGRLAALTPARAAGWIVLAWGVAGLILNFRLGGRLGGDSHRYLDAARPCYFKAHNFFILTTLLPAYLLAAARTLIPGLCGLQPIVVALTFADRDSRHSLPVLPFAFLFAAAGLVRPTGAPDP